MEIQSRIKKKKSFFLKTNPTDTNALYDYFCLCLISFTYYPFPIPIQNGAGGWEHDIQWLAQDAASFWKYIVRPTSRDFSPKWAHNFCVTKCPSWAAHMVPCRQSESGLWE